MVLISHNDAILTNVQCLISFHLKLQATLDERKSIIHAQQAEIAKLKIEAEAEIAKLKIKLASSLSAEEARSLRRENKRLLRSSECSTSDGVLGGMFLCKCYIQLQLCVLRSVPTDNRH